MPKIKKFRDLSRRQQNRRLLLQTKNENITYRKNVIVNSTKVIVNSSTCTKCLSEDNASLDAIELPANIISTVDIQSESNIIQSEQDFILVDNTIKQGNSTLKEKLHTWATEYNITQRSLTALLIILKEEGHNELPGDARTLLDTPKETIIRECESGHYFHYGLAKSLRDKLKDCTNINSINTIEININIDGLPLAKSSQSQLWPILGQINNIADITDPFLIGAYHGYKKPSNVKNFLQEFCEEFKILNTEGFMFQNKKIFVTIRAIICDAPAKAFVTATKGHNAYFGCGKCFCEGDYINHRMVFLDENAPLRTDNNFRNRENEEHHLSVSPFENLPV